MVIIEIKKQVKKLLSFGYPDTTTINSFLILCYIYKPDYKNNSCRGLYTDKVINLKNNYSIFTSYKCIFEYLFLVQNCTCSLFKYNLMHPGDIHACKTVLRYRSHFTK